MGDTRLLVQQQFSDGDRITVEGQQAHHLLHVLRLRTGAALRVFDGCGHEHHARLTDSGRARVTLDIGKAIPGARESALRLDLAQGIARHDRMDLILQKAVELGVSNIQPLWLQRSQSRLSGERLEKRILHWQGIINSACEQCGRNILPQLHPPLDLAQWLHSSPQAAMKLLLQPDSASTLTQLSRPDGAIVLLAGPEGGLDGDEQALASAAGFTGIRLGPRILRTETAALAAIAGLQTLWGDFR
ncbi:MAG: 16S rRNA (uracil(1498)-N(3))-methyltransferase [Pseudomonadota bacterium]